jgi:predicted ATP-binding protein involved in virulence
VLRRFTETFKNCQFIVTTHSPQVLGEVEGRCVRFLLYEDDQIIAWTPQHAMGLDSNRILEELMDATPRNVEIEERLHKLFQLIDNENFSAAHRCIEALEETLGDNDPELTRARTLMAFLEGE